MSELNTAKTEGREPPALADAALLATYEEQGWLLRVGCNYYAGDLEALPQDIRKRVKAVKPSKYGVRLVFYMKRGPRYEIDSCLGNFLR